MDFNKPIFIVGCTNSGTKCLLHSLLEHPDLGGLTKELHFYGIAPNIEGRLNRLFALYPCFNTNYLSSSNSKTPFDSGPNQPELIREYLSSLLKTLEPDKSIPGDRFIFKDPKLSLRIKWLKEVFPDCFIISIVRNPWSVAEGIKRKLSVMGDSYMNIDIPTAMAQWINSNSVIQLDSKGISNFIQVRYEDMIAANIHNKNHHYDFWANLLLSLDLDPYNFVLPGKSKYSHFDQSRDKFSGSNLTRWEKDFIFEAGKSLIEKFGYERI